MNKKRILGIILFWATLISPIVSFSLAAEIGESNIFAVAGIVRYSWIMLLFIPIGVISLIIGFKLKISKQKYKKNFIIAFICLPLLIIFGNYRFIFYNIISYDTNEVSIIEDKINIGIPDNIKVAKVKLDLYNICYAKIIDNESKEAFEQEIGNSQLWQEELNTQIKTLLPLDVQYESEVFDYFLFFNVTSGEYNILPSSGQYECIFIEYDSDLHRLFILSDYKININ